jgi:hypothetical protein
MAMDHLVEQDIANAVFLYLKGTDIELRHAADFKTRFCGLLPDSSNDLIAVGEYGEVVVVSQTGAVSEDIINANGVSPEGRGPLTRGAIIEDRVVMVGMDRQVYRREPTGAWVVMEDGLPPESTQISGLTGVAGPSLSSLYAVGCDGEIWKFDGSRWSAMASPTKLMLTAVCVADDDRVYACGGHRAVSRATNDQWETVATDCWHDLWSIVCFNSEIFAAGLRRLYRLNAADELELVDAAGCDSFGTFAKSKDALWSIGAKAVISYDGKDWTQLA